MDCSSEVEDTSSFLSRFTVVSILDIVWFPDSLTLTDADIDFDIDRDVDSSLFCSGCLDSFVGDVTESEGWVNGGRLSTNGDDRSTPNGHCFEYLRFGMDSNWPEGGDHGSFISFCN